jgi:DNA repair photolyase
MKAARVNDRKITLGTKEWADSNVNVYNGCSNNCRYCYARKMAIRFGRKTEETWKIMEPNRPQIDKGYRKRNGRIMFPTSHDITVESLQSCLIVLEKLLQAENEVLITTKPRYECIKKICDNFKDYEPQIQFRFTITSLDSKLLSFWEPGAPSFKERLKSLKFAHSKGYKTSISIEPFLDENPYELLDVLLPHVTESIWIGKMNYIKASNILPCEQPYYDRIREINHTTNLSRIIANAEKYQDNIIKIKDSIFNYLQS